MTASILLNKRHFAVGILMAFTPFAWGYDSGSTGSDGAFTPTVDTQLQLPADGIFNFTTVTIPTGVTVTFQKNQANTPVIILTSGDLTIDGTLNISGIPSSDVGSAGDGNVGDDGLPGVGGPGGYDGGRGGLVADVLGSTGLGPGGGGPALGNIEHNGNGLIGLGCGGNGGGYVGQGGDSRASGGNAWVCNATTDEGPLGQAYGTPELLPLIGGSGGGGASAGFALSGSGGGGGGGALLIASSGTVSVGGSINANGGRSGASNGGQAGGTGGGGSGGAVRIIATTIDGNGAITATGGARGAAFGSTNNNQAGGVGSSGRIRLEAETFLRTAATSPAFSFAQPQEIFVAGMPALRITSVAGVAAPASPTGNADIVLPSSTTNPVTVAFESTNVPVGNTVELTLIPASGATTNVVSGALSGTEVSATTSVSVTLPDGPSTLMAQVTYTVTVAQAGEFSTFTEGEMVARVRLSADPANGSMTTFITESGREFTWPSNAVAFN